MERIRFGSGRRPWACSRFLAQLLPAPGGEEVVKLLIGHHRIGQFDLGRPAAVLDLDVEAAVTPEVQAVGPSSS
ncbi:MAG: hypothetical protein HS126_21795 [Anaerolineales bacterium]|nr:hypothetical protein [Anaerolineales bacterium]